MIDRLLSDLVACDSTNPDITPGGVGEAAVATIIAGRLSAAGLEVDRYDVAPGRPNVVATLRGTGGGRRLMLCGHMDVVGALPEQFRPEIRDGRLYGRGSHDMKAGLAAAIVAVERIVASGTRLRGDVVVAALCDEEWRSIGAEELVRRSGADAAILPEPSNLEVITAHGGFSWHEITSHGVQAAGVEQDRGRDAIGKLGPILTAIRDLDRELERRPAASYGRGSIHASTITGGEQLPVYPSRCVVGIERCLIPGETWRGAEDELRAMIAATVAGDPDARFDLTTIVGRDPVELGADEPVVALLVAAATAAMGGPPVVRGEIGWQDSGILVDAGIPCVVFGPTGAGEHTDCEWVDLASVETCAAVLEATARAFCG
jgi:acetylornithine deacetylase